VSRIRAADARRLGARSNHPASLKLQHDQCTETNEYACNSRKRYKNLKD
jgi:hypothetical protein